MWTSVIRGRSYAWDRNTGVVHCDGGNTGRSVSPSPFYFDTGMTLFFWDGREVSHTVCKLRDWCTRVSLPNTTNTHFMTQGRCLS